MAAVRPASGRWILWVPHLGIFPACSRAVPKPMICIEAQMGMPGTCCTQMGREEAS